MDIFRNTDKKSKHLTLHLEDLDLIPPKSVESERAFLLFITIINLGWVMIP